MEIREMQHAWLTRAVLLRAVAGLSIIAIVAGGCENAGQGAVSGAGIGALSGLAIGSLYGDAGKGAVIGAVAGGVGGAVIGDQNRRRNEEQAQQQSYPPPSASGQQAYYASSALSRLVGDWKVRGSLTSGPDTVPVSGTAKAVVDKKYFVRIDLRLTDPRSGDTVEGTSIMSQTGGRGLDMTNSFSTSPETKQFKGTLDESGNVLTLTQTGNAKRRIVIRIQTGPGWNADVWDGNKRVESYTFAP